MLLNPRNPHHGVDCICDSCWKYWGEFARGLGKAVANERSTEPPVDAGSKSSDAGNEQGSDQIQKREDRPIIEAREPSCDGDSPSDIAPGTSTVATRRESIDGKTVRYRVELWDFDGHNPYYAVSDFQGKIVCQCAEKHNAKLIAWLLEYHS